MSISQYPADDRDAEKAVASQVGDRSTEEHANQQRVQKALMIDQKQATASVVDLPSTGNMQPDPAVAEQPKWNSQDPPK